MEAFLDQIKNTILKSTPNKIQKVVVLGNGDLVTKNLNDLIDEKTCVIIINSFKGLRLPQALKVVNIIKDEFYFKYALSDDIIVDRAHYSSDYLWSNLPIFALEIAKRISNEIIVDGFSFNVKSDMKEKTYNFAYFQQQKENFEDWIKKNPFVKVLRKRFNEEYSSISDMIDKKIKKNELIIVAEVTNNHLGELKTLCNIAYEASRQGADLIKIQKRDVDSFYTKEELLSEYTSPFGNTLEAYRRKVELSYEDILKFDLFCKEHNIFWYASILDLKSYTDMSKLFDLELIKIPSTISEHKNYIRKVSESYNGHIVVSTGATSEDYVHEIINMFHTDKSKLFLCHTVSSYPTPIEEANIGIVAYYNKLTYAYKNLVPGYSGHDLGNTGAMLAVAAGANMVEKHVKYGTNDFVHFDKVAVDLLSNDFVSYVQDVRLAEKIRGSYEKRVLSIEHHKYKTNGNAN